MSVQPKLPLSAELPGAFVARWRELDGPPLRIAEVIFSDRWGWWIVCRVKGYGRTFLSWNKSASAQADRLRERVRKEAKKHKQTGR